MKTKTPPPSIQITPELKKRVDCNKYECIEGSKEENVVCALLVVIGTAGIPMTAKDFLTVYIWFVQTLHAGINADFNLHPRLKGTRLFKDAREMKGKKNFGILERESVFKVSSFISDDNREFEEVLDTAISIWESELLISEFLPFSTRVAVEA